MVDDGGFQKLGGYSYKWRVNQGKSMMTGGTPICGTPHLDFNGDLMDLLVISWDRMVILWDLMVIFMDLFVI